MLVGATVKGRGEMDRLMRDTLGALVFSMMVFAVIGIIRAGEVYVLRLVVYIANSCGDFWAGMAILLALCVASNLLALGASKALGMKGERVR